VRDRRQSGERNARQQEFPEHGQSKHRDAL
jgi:hypothetical protein